MTMRSQTHTFFYTLILFSTLTAQAQTGGGWKLAASPAGANYHGIQFVYFFNRKDGVVAGDSGFIRYTSDGGSTWQPPASIKSRKNAPLQLKDDFYRGMRVGDTLFLMGVQYLLYSKDSGRSWYEAGSPKTAKDLGITWEQEFFYADVFFAGEDEGWLLCIASRGAGKFMSYVLHTDNKGENWVTYASLPTDKKMWKMFFIDKKFGWVVGDGGTILESTDRGRSWDKLKRGPQWRLEQRTARVRQSLPNLLNIMFSNENEDEGVIVGTNGTILRTTDGGEEWYQVKPPRPPSKGKNHNDLVKVEFVAERGDESYWWIVGRSGEILCTSDGGESWVRQNRAVPHDLYSIYMLNLDVGWAGGDKRTLLSYRGDRHARCGFDDGERRRP
jgi:photosystem II stability/assembly factor-like uncharacterized protein